MEYNGNFWTEFLLNFAHNSIVFHSTFSNSLIIREVKTKPITTMKEVWIPGLN